MPEAEPAPQPAFQATVDADSIPDYRPAAPVLRSAASFDGRGLRRPNLSGHVTERTADCGDLVAARQSAGQAETPGPALRAGPGRQGG